MQNEWFFKWHLIGRDGPVEIDSFDGRVAQYAGIRFFGSPREVYWQVLKRYLENKVAEYFDDAEKNLDRYPVEIRDQIVIQTGVELRTFSRQISHDAVEKDRILRGDGTSFPSRDDSYVERFFVFEQIGMREHALIELNRLKKPAIKGRAEKLNHVLKEYKELIALLTTVSVAIGAVAWNFLKPLLGKFFPIF
ncbi:MAG: hypothetical protein U1A28_05250 [Patescibacteria group bacterium]|nr:hypothetical protein [Patescibacteria group bacterium]